MLLRCVYGGSIYKHSGAVQQHGHLQHSRTISRALRAMFCRFLFWPTPCFLSVSLASDPRRFCACASPCAALYSETRYLASRETRLYIVRYVEELRSRPRRNFRGDPRTRRAREPHSMLAQGANTACGSRRWARDTCCSGRMRRKCQLRLEIVPGAAWRSVLRCAEKDASGTCSGRPRVKGGCAASGERALRRSAACRQRPCPWRRASSAGR